MSSSFLPVVSPNPSPAQILVVDDLEVNRTILVRRLQREGHQVITAENGQQALQLLEQKTIDLILLDVMMPEMGGYDVLLRLKQSDRLSHIPVVVISALTDFESVVRCIELGAEDYLLKPFNPTILWARINACLEKKRLRDQERAYIRQLQVEQAKADQLLLHILPRPIAHQLKESQYTIAESFADVTVLFADIVGFTALAAERSPMQVVQFLNQIFCTFDHLALKHGVEKIKTIGDAYMAVSGMPTERPDHAIAMAEMALEMQRAMQAINQATGETFQLRIGMHCGPVVAGVIGSHKFSYDLWGDTVNLASRMESQGLENRIQVTETLYERLRDRCHLESRGLLPIKGKGLMNTYWLLEDQATRSPSPMEQAEAALLRTVITETQLQSRVRQPDPCVTKYQTEPTPKLKTESQTESQTNLKTTRLTLR
ncbi:MAG: adenylate/guanylate cyclase domain-containing protein [Synechococcales bacterium]|nr:adenylate/guanylate cyclase domain-containing protein [Synechococcales bacterium]